MAKCQVLGCDANDTVHLKGFHLCITHYLAIEHGEKLILKPDSNGISWRIVGWLKT